MTDVRFMREEILGEFPGLAVQPDSKVVVHSGRPDIRLVVELRIIRTRPLRGNLPLRDLLRLWIEHRHAVAVKYTAPQAVLGVDVSSPATRAFRREVVPDSLQGLAIRHPDLVVTHLHAVRVVLRICNNIVGESGRAARRVRDASPRVGSQVDVPDAAHLAGRESDVEPQLAIHMLERGVNHRQMAIAETRLRYRGLEGFHPLRLWFEANDLHLRHVAEVDPPLVIDIDLETALSNETQPVLRDRILHDLAGFGI